MQIEHLYNHCFYIEDLSENDLFPIGGGFIGSTDTPYKLRADFQNIYPKFSAASDQHKSSFQSDQWQQWFQKVAPDIAPELLTVLQTFTAIFETTRKKQSTDSYARNKLYQEAPGNIVNLSDVFSNNQAMCAEISLLAKKFLDGHRIKSFLFSGEAMFEFRPNNFNYPEAHTFLIINYREQELIYDPTNPIQLGDRDLVALMKPRRSLLSGSELKKDCLLVESENVITHHKIYYGVGDGSNIPESLIIRAREPGRSDIINRSDKKLTPS